MIDADGFRPNVGMIVSNSAGQLLFARRVGRRGWQFPQGGIDTDETPEQALYRELYEELGLAPEAVDILGSTRGWLRYRLPARYMRRDREPLCRGQKQVWFLLRLACDEQFVSLDQTDTPEFDHWRWVDYWQPLREVIYFKREVYRRALAELAPILFPEGAPEAPAALKTARTRGGRRRSGRARSD